MIVWNYTLWVRRDYVVCLRRNEHLICLALICSLLTASLRRFYELQHIFYAFSSHGVRTHWSLLWFWFKLLLCRLKSVCARKVSKMLGYFIRFSCGMNCHHLISRSSNQAHKVKRSIVPNGWQNIKWRKKEKGKNKMEQYGIRKTAFGLWWMA